jgi:hypothetical protein
VGDVHRLGHEVSNEYGGDVRLANEAEKVFANPCCRQLVERCKCLVRVQDFWFYSERTGDRNPLAHTA